MITYSPKFNFHNASALTIRLSTRPIESYAGMVYPVTASQADRIRKHFCGVADCKCNSGALIQLDPDSEASGIPVKFCSN